MYHVYLLRSRQFPERTYVGYTSKDVGERLEEHNRGTTTTTAPHAPWQLEVCVSFQDECKAQSFERYLKHGSGYAFAKRHLWSANTAELKKQSGGR